MLNKEKIIDFFSFLKNSTALNQSLNEFKNRPDLRQYIWNNDLRDLTSNSKIYDDLLNVSWDLSLDSLNDKNDSFLYDSILILSIENFKIDYRDSILRLSAINHACIKMKIELSELINFVEEYSSDRSMKYFNMFLLQTKAEKSLKAMGLRETKKNGVISIEQIPPPWMKS